WRDGAFVSPAYTPTTPTVEKGADWNFRVRSLRFSPGATTARAVAITAGCCYSDPTTGLPDPSKNNPRVISFLGDRWVVHTLYDKSSGKAQVQSLPDSFYGFTFAAAGSMSVVSSAGGPKQDGEPVSRVIGNVSVPTDTNTSTTDDIRGLALNAPISLLAVA